MATAIRGCVITDQSPTRLSFSRKCEYCGYVPKQQVHTSQIHKGVRHVRHFKCQKCGRNNTIEILG